MLRACLLHLEKCIAAWRLLGMPCSVTEAPEVDVQVDAMPEAVKNKRCDQNCVKTKHCFQKNLCTSLRSTSAGQLQ